MAAMHRPFGALVRMLGHVDAVHGAYYMLMWPLASLLGTSELIMRLPSLVAMALAAGVVTATGRRLASPAVGLAAGLVFAVSPTVSEYGQMARSYALVTLAAAATSYFLVRAVEDETSRRRWIPYGAAMAVLGALNIFALLLIPAHAITMLVRYRARRGEPVGRAAARRSFAGWLSAAAAAAILNGPLIDLASHQRSQIAWLSPPNLQSVGNAADLLGPPWMTVAIVATILAGGVATLARARVARRGTTAGRGRAWPDRTGWRPVLTLCLPWLVLPAAILLITSALVAPVYTDRYILFCMPAFALIAGSALIGLATMPGRPVVGRMTALTAFLLIAVLGVGLQVQYRQPFGHLDDIRAADEIIAASARPGDVVVYESPQFLPMSAAYPYGLGQLPDPQVGRAAIPSGTLVGTVVRWRVLRERLGRVRRMWLVEVNTDPPQTALLRGLHMRLVWTWQVSDIWLHLYVRQTVGNQRS